MVVLKFGRIAGFYMDNSARKGGTYGEGTRASCAWLPPHNFSSPRYLNIYGFIWALPPCGGPIYFLGQANAGGRWGLDKDPQEATRMYREMQKCSNGDSTEASRLKAAAWLREHP